MRPMRSDKREDAKEWLAVFGDVLEQLEGAVEEITLRCSFQRIRIAAHDRKKWTVWPVGACRQGRILGVDVNAERRPIRVEAKYPAVGGQIAFQILIGGTDICKPSSLRTALPPHMPLSHIGGAVPGVAEQSGERRLASPQLGGDRVWAVHIVQDPVAMRVLAGKEGGARRTADAGWRVASAEADPR